MYVINSCGGGLTIFSMPLGHIPRPGVSSPITHPLHGTCMHMIDAKAMIRWKAHENSLVGPEEIAEATSKCEDSRLDYWWVSRIHGTVGPAHQ